MHRSPSFAALAFAFVLALAAAGAAAQEDAAATSRGQTVYVPVYSELHHGNLDGRGSAAAEQLSVLVSVRNTDPSHPIRIVSAPYFDSDGRLLRQALPAARTLSPLGSLELFVEQRDGGGAGASFLLRWEADRAVSPPLVEALHTRIQAGRSIAFVTRGRPLPAAAP